MQTIQDLKKEFDTLNSTIAFARNYVYGPEVPWLSADVFSA